MTIIERAMTFGNRVWLTLYLIKQEAQIRRELEWTTMARRQRVRWAVAMETARKSDE